MKPSISIARQHYNPVSISSPYATKLIIFCPHSTIFVHVMPRGFCTIDIGWYVSHVALT